MTITQSFLDLSKDSCERFEMAVAVLERRKYGLALSSGAAIWRFLKVDLTMAGHN